MKVMKMFVWNPQSLSDYYDGMVCVIAENKHEAIELAIEERYPYTGSGRRGLTAREKAAVDRNNQHLAGERLKFRDELKREKPKIIRRGAVHINGGG
jgi:hypothetical protein